MLEQTTPVPAALVEAAGQMSFVGVPAPQGLFALIAQNISREISDITHAPSGQSTSDLQGEQTVPSPSHTPARGTQSLVSASHFASRSQLLSAVHSLVQNFFPAESAMQRLFLLPGAVQSTSFSQVSQKARGTHTFSTSPIVWTVVSALGEALTVAQW